MKYTKLGRSNLTVSRVCLGTMHFGNATGEKEAFAIMDRALEMGINFFDTANMYGGPDNRGGSETIIGNWLAQGGGRRDRIVLATKVFGNMAGGDLPNEEPGISAYKVRKHAADSLRRLRTDHIDLYQVHHIDYHITGEEFWGCFDKLVDDGDVLYMGTSNFPGWGLVKFQDMAAARGRLGIISEQTQYNLLNRGPEMEVLPACLELGVGAIPYMPLAGGILTGKTKSKPGSRTANVENEYGITVEGSSQVEAFHKICGDLGEPAHAVAIAWALSHPAVASPIVGIRKIEHLEGLERAAELELDTETLAKLNEIFDINKGRPFKPGPAPGAFAW
jgi:aryl-alcohol dehydrogenase-like predicted oxidoreductase